MPLDPFEPDRNLHMAEGVVRIILFGAVLFAAMCIGAVMFATFGGAPK